uniref:Uncharacterized protein TCIL3000_3_2520 n=1 Tax=Trypanosoma congolense (strain IL3000) TaxID=1068625 RepID=G0UKB4_TRYCI|nr:unnamed protein product [Trypanosoma congolense IL3000]
MRLARLEKQRRSLMRFCANNICSDLIISPLGRRSLLHNVAWSTPLFPLERTASSTIEGPSGMLWASATYISPSRPPPCRSTTLPLSMRPRSTVAISRWSIPRSRCRVSSGNAPCPASVRLASIRCWSVVTSAAEDIPRVSRPLNQQRYGSECTIL